MNAESKNSGEKSAPAVIKIKQRNTRNTKEKQ